MSENFRLYRKIGFLNTFYIKCVNVVIDSIGPSIILRSIYASRLRLLYIFFSHFITVMALNLSQNCISGQFLKKDLT